MVKAYKDKRVLVLSFILSLFSIKAEAGNSVDSFYDQEPVVYQKAYQVSLKEKSATREDGDQLQAPVALYIGGPNQAKESGTKINIITKAHRTKVSTPLRGPSVVSNPETSIVLDMPNNHDKETGESETTSENNEENVFEVVNYTRDILGQGVPTPDIFSEEIG
jgi:hypothetical protein